MLRRAASRWARDVGGAPAYSLAVCWGLSRASRCCADFFFGVWRNKSKNELFFDAACGRRCIFVCGTVCVERQWVLATSAAPMLSRRRDRWVGRVVTFQCAAPGSATGHRAPWSLSACVLWCGAMPSCSVCLALFLAYFSKLVGVTRASLAIVSDSFWPAGCRVSRRDLFCRFIDLRILSCPGCQRSTDNGFNDLHHEIPRSVR